MSPGSKLISLIQAGSMFEQFWKAYYHYYYSRIPRTVDVSETIKKSMKSQAHGFAISDVYSDKKYRYDFV